MNDNNKKCIFAFCKDNLASIKMVNGTNLYTCFLMT